MLFRSCPMGTPCGLKTVTAGTPATNLHFLLRPTSPPYYEIMFKIIPQFLSVNRYTFFSLPLILLLQLRLLSIFPSHRTFQGTHHTSLSIFIANSPARPVSDLSRRVWNPPLSRQDIHSKNMNLNIKYKKSYPVPNHVAAQCHFGTILPKVPQNLFTPRKEQPCL